MGQEVPEYQVAKLLGYMTVEQRDKVSIEVIIVCSNLHLSCVDVNVVPQRSSCERITGVAEGRGSSTQSYCLKLHLCTYLICVEDLRLTM